MISLHLLCVARVFVFDGPFKCRFLGNFLGAALLVLNRLLFYPFSGLLGCCGVRSAVFMVVVFVLRSLSGRWVDCCVPGTVSSVDLLALGINFFFLDR